MLPADALARLPNRRERRGDDEKVEAQEISGVGVGLRQAMDLDHILPDHEGPGLDPIAPPACHLLGSVDLVDRKEEVDIEGCSRARVDRERLPPQVRRLVNRQTEVFAVPETVRVVVLSPTRVPFVSDPAAVSSAAKMALSRFCFSCWYLPFSYSSLAISAASKAFLALIIAASVVLHRWGDLG